MIIFVKGLLIGIAIASPIGPVAINCLHRTMQFGRLSGFISGIGAAVGDALYGAIGAFGLTFISEILLSSHMVLRLFGGFFLVVFGLRIYFKKIHNEPEKVAHQSLIGDFFSSLVLTLSNPMTLLAFFAIFAAFGLSTIHGNYKEASYLVFGVFVGAALWWLLLSTGISLCRGKCSPRLFRHITQGAGLVVISFGVGALASIFI